MNRRARTAHKLAPNTDEISAPRSGMPPQFRDWFERRGWTPRSHQLELIAQSRARRSTLLVAPTGAGKTLASFLPGLISMSERKKAPRSPATLHTLYISPLKALAADVARNLFEPVAEMGLPIRIETRTGDTSIFRKAAQRRRPPDILLTTPEQIALLLSHPDATHLFEGLDTVILDELHALAPSKRGDLLALGLARLTAIAPSHIRIGLSATVARPADLRAYLMPQGQTNGRQLADILEVPGGAPHDIRLLPTEAEMPWGGHMTGYAAADIYKCVKAHQLSLIFVNTRRQAEFLFQHLWNINDENLPIGLHHGSLDASQRRKVEAAMAAGTLRAVVSTSTLDLGVDWGDVDLVINVGAPKGVSRLVQRVGRANHRLDEQSVAYLVPSNRFELLECHAAIAAAAAGELDGVEPRAGALDVLAQHVLGTACAGPFDPRELFAQVRSAAPYASLTSSQFDRVVDFVSTGGYALRAYERYARLKPLDGEKLRLAHSRLIQQYRMNAGTIVEAPMIKIRRVGRGASKKARGEKAKPLGRGRLLGELEESFIEQLRIGDTFAFAGEVLRFEGLRDTEAIVSPTRDDDPMIPSYAGGKFPLSTLLARRVRAMLADARTWKQFPAPVCEWLYAQAERSTLPRPDEVLIESFPRGRKQFLVIYPFEGRLAHQTLGMLLTRRLDRIGAKPLGFVANDYALAVWGLKDINELRRGGRLDLDDLFHEDMLGDDLEEWIAESALMKRTFRVNAVISGLIERRHPGAMKSGRQVTISSDLIYDVLRKHDPGHILLEAAWADAATGLIDLGRLSEFLRRVKGKLRFSALTHVSPLAVPVLLEIGQEPAGGSDRIDDILQDAADILIRDAMS